MAQNESGTNSLRRIGRRAHQRVMVRRSEPKSKADERAFPIRLKFRMPEAGLRERGWQIENWLRDELGDRDYAVHSQRIDFLAYFRKLADAQRFVDAFPSLELADGIAEAYGIRTPRRPVHENWHAIGGGWEGP